jgi:hypothetical protein
MSTQDFMRFSGKHYKDKNKFYGLYSVLNYIGQMLIVIEEPILK